MRAGATTPLLGVALVGVCALSLAVGAQAAYTDVGERIGPRWSEPATLATVDAADADAGGDVTALAAAAGRVAWVETDGREWRVRLATVEPGSGGRLAAGGVRTLASRSGRIEGVDVAVSADGRLAAVWERADADAIVLHDGGRARVLTADRPTTRRGPPRVAFADGRPVVAFREFRGDAGFTARVHVVGGPAGDVGASVAGRGAPAVAPRPDGGGVALAWIDGDGLTVEHAAVDVGAELRVAERRDLGRARPTGGFGGGGRGAAPAVDAAAGPRVVWTDLGTVHAWRGGGEPAAVASGRRAAVAAVGDRGGDAALTTWLFAARPTGTDVGYRLDGDDGGGGETGAVSRLPSNAVRAEPFRAGAAGPGVAWTERSGDLRLLASAYDPDGESSVPGRLGAAPGRFLFVGVAAALVGAVLLPLSPWVVGPLLAGFLATTGTALGVATGVAARLASRAGRDVDARRLRERLRDLPLAVPVALFVVADLAVLVAVVGGGDGTPAAGLAIRGPVALSAAAAVATAAVARAAAVASPWRVAVLFAYLQSVALVATALPGVL
jgi:hypothetical protein